MPFYMFCLTFDNQQKQHKFLFIRGFSSFQKIKYPTSTYTLVQNAHNEQFVNQIKTYLSILSRPGVIELFFLSLYFCMRLY